MSTVQKILSPVAKKRAARASGSRPSGVSSGTVGLEYEKVAEPDLLLGGAHMLSFPGSPVRIHMVGVQEQSLADRAHQLTSMRKAIAGQLTQTGFSANAIDLLRQLTRIELESARLAMAGAAQTAERARRDEPGSGAADAAYALLTASKMAEALNVSDETVRNYEKEHKLFSFLAPARRRGRSYPAFQAMKHIVGAPLAKVLFTLKELDGASIYQFFSSPNVDLAGLTPVEVMTGQLTLPRMLDNDGLQLLKAPDKDRLSTTVGSAKTFLADAVA